MARLIELIDVTKTFGSDDALCRVNLYIRQNEFVTLLGPSGCGKTTTLRIIGGFSEPTSGDVLFNGKSMLNTPPYKRALNTVFQKYALFPHMNVYENVAFGLQMQKVAKPLIREKVSAMLVTVGLAGFEARQIQSLSGGQQQRVAIARALVNEPQVLLLDEPLGALDQKLRREMQLELKNMQRALGITFVYVTHDQEEALSMSDTIAVMNRGQILQIGTPEDIYNEPKNAFVAEFIGESNVIPGVMERDFLVQFLDIAHECVDSGFEANAAVDVVIRPEDVLLSQDSGKIAGTVMDAVFKGVHYEMHISAGGFNWKVQSTRLSRPGEHVWLDFVPENIHVMKGTPDT